VTALVPQIILAVAAVALGAWAYFRPKQGWTAWVAAAATASATAALHFGAFWPCVLMLSVALIFLVCSFDFIDLGFRFRLGVVLAVCALAAVVLWPSAQAFSGGRLPCPEWVKQGNKFRLAPGLDLRGGLRLTYNVEVDEAIRDKRDRDYETMRSELVRVFGLHEGDSSPSEESYVKLRDKATLEAPRQPADVILLTVKDPADKDKIDARFLDKFRGDLSYSVGPDGRSYQFRIKASVRGDVRERAVGQAHQIILRRVDELGLREASVSTRDEDIIVEVPGEDEASFASIRDIISQTARLEFKLLDDEHDFFGPLRQSADKTSLPEGLTFRQENTSVGTDADGDALTKTITYAHLERQPNESSKQALERFRAWADTLQLPPDRELGFELDYAVEPGSTQEAEAGWRTYLLKSKAEITGDLIRDALAQPDQGANALGGWHVAITFTDAGGSIFERITGANIKRRFAIILDGRVESAPVIQGRIAGGHASITLGASDPETQLREARKLELVLRSGALPASITPINEQRVGPTLGRDAIERAVEAAVAGSFAVLLFMFIYYRRSGLIADVVVMMNLMLQLAILCTLGASITLPGICGLALTIGMSVDSNVLINERLRDETRGGKTPRSAVEVGFKRALNAIIDGHVTTLISGIVLFQFGTGPIKGFASALLVGMAANLFTGVVVSRVLFDFWVRGFRTQKLDVGALEFFPVGKTLDFMGKKGAFIAFSIFTVLATVVLAFVPGPVYGTDFKGGTEVEVAMKREVEPSAIREAVEKAGFDSPEVVRVEEGSSAHRYLIRVHEVSAIDESTQVAIQKTMCFGEGVDEAACPPDKRPTEIKVSPGGDKISLRYEQEPDLSWIRERIKTVPSIGIRDGENNPVLQSAREHKVEIYLKGKGDQIMDGLRASLGPDTAPDDMLRSEWIGPKAGAQLRSSAIKSVAVAFLFIMLYIALRFDLRFAPGAVVAVAHDAVVTTGLLIAMGKEINLTIVAALLTVVGYSTNDKVVIYDRIRENLHKIRGMSFQKLINISLSETFSRTIITGGPTILSLVAFFFWGTGALKDFALTLILGTIIGTYSSMYIAVPFTSWLDAKFFNKKKQQVTRKPPTGATARA
jgi:preprotein translocase subunit SecD